jgi:hypothetical protein
MRSSRERRETIEGDPQGIENGPLFEVTLVIGVPISVLRPDDKLHRRYRLPDHDRAGVQLGHLRRLMDLVIPNPEAA